MGESVYNPFDLLLLFDKRDFRAYWFETGTPTFLVDLLRSRQTFIPQLDTLVADDQLLGAFDVEYIGTEALLWQTGDLTITGVERLGGLVQYQLGYPNREVESALQPGAAATEGLRQQIPRRRPPHLVAGRGVQQHHAPCDGVGGGGFYTTAIGDVET